LAAGPFSSSASSFDWTSSSTAATPTTAMTNDCATEWPLVGLNDDFDYDALLNDLSSGL
jgi:hypothetical protein